MGDFSVKSVVFAFGVVGALGGLGYYQRWIQRRRDQGVAVARVGVSGALTEGGHLALLIAVGIGLHNFAEGLAIGQSAARGEVSLAVLLVAGFALHNGTEGFGIVAPMSSEEQRPRAGFLALLSLIGGGRRSSGRSSASRW